MDFAKILSKIDSIQSTKQLNESAKPDFLDIDKDGDRKEPMKKAAADKKKRDVKEDAVNEVSAPGQEDWIKKNKQRFIDQYGKKKGMEVLYATAWKRSKKVDEARQLEECYGQAMQSMSNTMDDRSGMNVSSSMDTRTGSKTLTVSAEGDAADQLAQMLKLSGLVGGTASSQDVELEEYANEPAPQVQGIETQLQQGNDLNRPKKMTPHGYQNGDNPLAMDVREQEELSALTQALSEELAGIKVDKSKVPAYQRKQQGGDWKTTQQDLQRERERNISGAEGLAALKKKQGVAEGSAHGYNVAKWYEKNGDQLKLTRWLRKEAGLPKDAPVYFDDADLVYGDKTIVPGALVNPKLKFNDLLTALTQATGGQGKQNVDGVYRESGVAEGIKSSTKK